MFDLGSMGEPVRIGVYLAGAITVWLVIDKTFRKIISNQHKIQHTVDRVLFRLDLLDQILLRVQQPRAGEAEGGLARGDLDDIRRLLAEGLAGGLSRPTGASSSLDQAPPLPALADKTLLMFGLVDVDAVVRAVRQAGPRHVVGVDDTSRRLDEVRQRLVFEEKQSAELMIVHGHPRMALPASSVDYIVCDGPLQASFPLQQLLAEFRRVLAPAGVVRIGGGQTARRLEDVAIGCGFQVRELAPPVMARVAERTSEKADEQTPPVPVGPSFYELTVA